MVFVERVIPMEYAPKENIIVCQRPEVLNDLKSKLAVDVLNVADEQALEQNVVYAMKKFKHKYWTRAMVKFFRRSDNIPVLQKLDTNGTINFDPTTMHVRKVKDLGLINQQWGHFKMFIYAVYSYDHDSDFDLIFKEFLQGKEVIGVFDLMEPKPNKVHQCFVGDFLYEIQNDLLSFREYLIDKKITYPARVDGDLNQQILAARAKVFADRKGLKSLMPSIWLSDGRNLNEMNEPAEVIGRYRVLKIVGEGSVCFCLCSDFGFCLFK